MFSIGEFSRITGLSIKALRLYHEKDLLIPHTVDRSTGYRYYTHEDAERARLIRSLRDMEMSLADIQIILDQGTSNQEILQTLENQKQQFLEKVIHYNQIIENLEVIISAEKEATMAQIQSSHEVEEKILPETLMAGIRFKGRYDECGSYFGQLFRKMGLLVCGKPFNLYYDPCYQEENADIESCIPIRKVKEVEGVSVRPLSGGKCITLIHQGPYDQLGRSYEKISAYINEKGIEVQSPIREIYIKGPGMFFKGNPKKYITEIQMMIDEK